MEHIALYTKFFELENELETKDFLKAQYTIERDLLNFILFIKHKELFSKWR